MLKSSWGVFSLILCAVLAISPTAAAADAGSELFVVSSSENGDANYLSLTDAVPAQKILQTTIDTDINAEVPEYYQFSEGNGLGDFDGDGDLDYIMAIGFFEGNIYISEKLDENEIVDGKRFAAPILVDNWGLGMDGGFLSMDFAVADYDEDGIDDFVLSVDFSTFSGIYLSGQYTGQEKFGFAYKPMKDNAENLIQNAALYSTGADAADFNNDGHADFVIAPSHDEPFYVSLGHGDGTFTTFPFDSIDGGAVSGVAAADFTGDGFTDIAAVYQGKLYVYEGTLVPGEWDIVETEWVNVGSGGSVDGVTFTYLEKDCADSDDPKCKVFGYTDLPIDISGLDNLDFNGDQYQDLVVSNYGAFPFPAGVAVLVNNGDGTFSHFATYPGVSGTQFNAVTAQPWKKPEPAPNEAPVAVIVPDYIESTVGVEIVFDGSNSGDEDGEDLSYAWDFGDDSDEATGVNPSHTYQQSGTYLVTLTVTDNQGAEASVQAEVVVAEPVIIPPPEEVPDDAEPIALRVKFSPRKLKLDGKKGKGKHAGYLKARIKFAQGFDARKVDRSSVYITAGNGSEIRAHVNKGRGFFHKLNRYHHKPRKSISVKFDRKDVLDAIGCPATNEAKLTVHGLIEDGGLAKEFEASGVIRLKMKKNGQCSAD